MINPMNIGDRSIETSTLHGEHKANIVYAKDVIVKDIISGTLRCKDVVLGEPPEDRKSLEWDDRIYYGVLVVGQLFVGDQEEADDSEQ